MLANLPWAEVIAAAGQTLYMVFIASFLSIFIGLALGLCLFNTRPHGLSPNQCLSEGLNIIINIGRSVPYIILMIALIPLTRYIVGSSIGINAAIVPLTIAAIPFYARITETALSEVPVGLIEAGYVMGASRWQIISKILLPESLANLIKGATLTIVSLVGYSAMAGAVGGGGLGELAINYGYQRFDVGVMLVTVVILVILVQATQWLGDALAKRPRVKIILWGSLLLWGLCFAFHGWSSQSNHEKILRVGIMAGINQDIMKVAQQEAAQKYHLKIEIIPFSDYVLPNTALNNGNIDANIFQHVPYLETQIKAHNYDLVPIAKTFIYPMGFYSNHYKNISELPDGVVIAIPNDPSNEGRALLLLAKAGLINLMPDIGLKVTVRDVRDNPHQFKLVAMDAAQIPRALSDVALGALTNDYIKLAGFTVNQALLKEGPDSPYVNIIAIRAQDKNRAELKQFVAVMHSQPVINATMQAFPNGAAVIGWKQDK